MTVGQLIELLQDHDQDAQVQLASQPSYPQAYTVGGVASSEYLSGTSFEDTPVVYLTEGSQVGYASRELWDVAESRV